MLAERVVDWTQQWRQEGRQEGLQEVLHSERRMLLQLVRYRFGDAMVVKSLPNLEQIQQPGVFEELNESLLDGLDETSWLARLESVVNQVNRH